MNDWLPSALAALVPSTRLMLTVYLLTSSEPARLLMIISEFFTEIDMLANDTLPSPSFFSSVPSPPGYVGLSQLVIAASAATPIINMLFIFFISFCFSLVSN